MKYVINEVNKTDEAKVRVPHSRNSPAEIPGFVKTSMCEVEPCLRRFGDSIKLL